MRSRTSGLHSSLSELVPAKKRLVFLEWSHSLVELFLEIQVGIHQTRQVEGAVVGAECGWELGIMTYLYKFRVKRIERHG